MPRVLSAFIAENGVAALIAEAVGLGMVAAWSVYLVGEAIHYGGLNPFMAIAAEAAPGLSSSMEPASGLHPSGFDPTIAGER